jgi:carbonic anhydrase
MNSKEDRMHFESYLSEHIAAEAIRAPGVPLLMLSCMDSRYPQRILDTMDSLGLRGKYDQLILAGASLGIVHKEEWRNTFMDQLHFAIEHHHVSQILILDHRDCGAYKYFLGVTPDDPAKEKQAHVEKCQEAAREIIVRFPELHGKVHALLLPIETVEQLAID